MVPKDGRVIAVGSMSASDLLVLRSSLNQLWPVDETPCCESLLQAIDDAEGKWQGRREAKGSPDQPTIEITPSG